LPQLLLLSAEFAKKKLAMSAGRRSAGRAVRSARGTGAGGSVSRARAINRHELRRGANSVTSAVPIGSTPPMPMPADSKNDPKPGKKREQSGRPPVSKESSPCFLSVICFWRKSLIPLSDWPFVLNCLAVFLGKSPCFRVDVGFGAAARSTDTRQPEPVSRP
jgi:hypothetical protein